MVVRARIGEARKKGGIILSGIYGLEKIVQRRREKQDSQVVRKEV